MKYLEAYETWLGWSQIGRVREGRLESVYYDDCERQLSPNRQMQVLWTCLVHASAVTRIC